MAQRGGWQLHCVASLRTDAAAGAGAEAACAVIARLAARFAVCAPRRLLRARNKRVSVRRGRQKRLSLKDCRLGESEPTCHAQATGAASRAGRAVRALFAVGSRTRTPRRASTRWPGAHRLARAAPARPVPKNVGAQRGRAFSTDATPAGEAAAGDASAALRRAGRQQGGVYNCKAACATRTRSARPGALA